MKQNFTTFDSVNKDAYETLIFLDDNISRAISSYFYISLSFCTSFKKCWKLKSVLSFLFLINKSFDLFIVIAVKKVFIIGRVWSSLKPDSVVLYYLI